MKNRKKKSIKTGKIEKNKYFRNFGNLSNDSIVTDIYNKRIKNKKKFGTRAKKCITRKMTNEEYEKYFGKDNKK